MVEMDYWERFAYRCWPGLADTWSGRRIQGLVWSVGMAWLANLLLIGTVLGANRVSTEILFSAWLMFAAIWLWGTRRDAVRRRNALRPPGLEEQGLFNLAQAEYLKGHWFEAQALLEQLLELSPGDADAQLMLATLFRRTKQWQAARDTLLRLEANELAEKWRLEIDHERRILDRSQHNDESAGPTSSAA